ncbi:hypothetical protein GP486_008583 [Trichoglossum hirsutum]|uniref:Carbohydrate kinase FGGY C-terminal domain-containing protein n=1 Tax=Trichoglossum hirsutum TaxID=265104 RepID=A0A9P8IFB9_9PEZI|nr:hypothetical protein GP486_008583 [Trichoglossum hirsutum]
MLVDIGTLEYDDELFAFFGLERGKLRLPRIVPSADAAAFGALAAGPLAGVRIAACLGDQSAALVGHRAFAPGAAKSTYGTGCFLLCNTGPRPVASTHGLITTVAYDLGHGPVYALEGSVAAAGSAVKFLQDNLGIIASPAEVGELAQTVPDNGGVVFVTAFSGLFAPYWIDDAKGTICMLLTPLPLFHLFQILTHTHTLSLGHLARATLEATCLQTHAVLAAMAQDSGQAAPSRLAVDGGMSNSDFFVQLQADVLGLPVNRPAMRETTALGAAIAAGLAAGLWRGLDDLERLGQEEPGTVFCPGIAPAERERMVGRWESAVGMCRGWHGEEAEEKDGDAGDGE